MEVISDQILKTNPYASSKLENSLREVHAALEPEMPENDAGIALYAHFTMDFSRWKTLETEFNHTP